MAGHVLSCTHCLNIGFVSQMRSQTLIRLSSRYESGLCETNENSNATSLAEYKNPLFAHTMHAQASLLNKGCIFFLHKDVFKFILGKVFFWTEHLLLPQKKLTKKAKANVKKNYQILHSYWLDWIRNASQCGWMVWKRRLCCTIQMPMHTDTSIWSTNEENMQISFLFSYRQIYSRYQSCDP